MPLFERHARGVRPTAAGEVLVRHAGRLLEGVAAADQELAGLRDRLAGRLVVGGFPTATAVLVPRAMARHPGLQVKLLEGSTPTQLVTLRRGRLEVAILATGDGLPTYDLDGLHLSELHSGGGAGVAVAESHPFAAREWVGRDELVDQTWVIGDRGGDSSEFGAWPGLGEPKVSFVVRDWPTRLGLVAAGLGIALVPGIAAQSVPRGVRWLPVRHQDGGLRRRVWAVTNANPSPAATAMVRALEEEVSDLSAAPLVWPVATPHRVA
jgi:DNA-binding transcriptional LysR family regulator